MLCITYILSSAPHLSIGKYTHAWKKDT